MPARALRVGTALWAVVALPAAAHADALAPGAIRVDLFRGWELDVRFGALGGVGFDQTVAPSVSAAAGVALSVYDTASVPGGEPRCATPSEQTEPNVAALVVAMTDARTGGPGGAGGCVLTRPVREVYRVRWSAAVDVEYDLVAERYALRGSMLVGVAELGDAGIFALGPSVGWVLDRAGSGASARVEAVYDTRWSLDAWLSGAQLVLQVGPSYVPARWSGEVVVGARLAL